MKKEPAKDQGKKATSSKKAATITLPSGRPIPQPNPTKPFRKGW